MEFTIHTDKKETSLLEFLQDYGDLFSEHKSMHVPQSHDFDMQIKLKEVFTPKLAPMYPLIEQEDEELKHIINENFQKGYIIPSTSP